MKGVMVAVRKGKSVAPVPLLLVDLTKPPLTVSTGLIEGLIPESC